MKGINVEFGADTSKFNSGISGMKSGIKGFSGATKTAMAGAAVAITGIVATIGVAIAGVQAAMSSVNEAADFETMQVQFETILGGAKAAQDRMQELADFAASTPFELMGIANASKTLETLTQGALSTGDGLRMVGDVAAASGQPIDELSTHMGRLYDGLKNGKAVGESLSRLNELGIISGSTRTQIENLQKAGKKGDEVWQVAAGAFGKFGGAMEAQSATFKGKVSTFKDGWADLKRTMGEPIMDSLKPLLDAAIKFLPTLKSGVASIGATISKVIGTVAALFGSGKITDVIKLSLIIAFKESVNFLTSSLFAGVSSVGELLKLGWVGVTEYINLTILNPNYWKSLGNIFVSIGLRLVEAINDSLPEFLQSKDFKSGGLKLAIDTADAATKDGLTDLGGQALEAYNKTLSQGEKVVEKFNESLSKQSDVTSTSAERKQLSSIISGVIPEAVKAVKDEAKKTDATKAATDDGNGLLAKFTPTALQALIPQHSLARIGGGAGNASSSMSSLTRAAMDRNKLLQKIVDNTTDTNSVCVIG